MPVTSGLNELAVGEFQYLEDIAKFGWEAAQARTDVSAARRQEILEMSGYNGDLQNIQSFLQDFIGNRSYDQFISQAGGIADGSSPFTQNQNQIINQVTGNTLGNNGLTNPLAQIQDRAFDITNTQGTAGLNELVDAQTTFGDVISVGGMTPALQELNSLGRSLVNSGGFTPELKSFLGTASRQIMSMGGMTPEMQEVFNTAKSIVDGSGSELMPMEEMISFARDEAQIASQRAGRQAIEQATRRGLTPGAAVSTGGDLAEFADSTAANTAKAIRDASLSAQDLRLQERMTALGIQGDVAKMSGQMKASVASALGSLNAGALSYAGNALNAGALMTNTANSQAINALGIAGQNMTNIGQLFADREQNGFNNLFGVNNSQNANMLNAFNMNGAMNGQTLTALQTAGGLQGQQDNSFLNGANQFGNNANNAFNNNRNILNDIDGSAAPFFNIAGQAEQNRANIFGVQAPWAAQPGMLNQTMNQIPGMVLNGAIGAATGQFGGGAQSGLMSLLGFGGGGSPNVSGSFNSGGYGGNGSYGNFGNNGYGGYSGSGGYVQTPSFNPYSSFNFG